MCSCSLTAAFNQQESIMKKSLSISITAIAVSALMAGAAFAGQPSVTCDQIQKSVQSGKTKEQVAKEMNVPLKRVNDCTQGHKK
jgi:hypothetical protein